MSIERIETEKTNPIKQDSIAGAALQEEDASAKFARELKSCEEEKNKIQRYDEKEGAHSDKEIATLEEQLKQASQKMNEMQSEYNQFSEDDEQKQKFRVVIERLRALQVEIEQKINEISSSNDFKKYERTYESAKQEDRSRDQKKASEKEKEARKKLMLEIDQIVEKIKKLCEDKSANSATVTKARSDMDAKEVEIFSMADETLAKQTDLVFTRLVAQ